MTSSEIAAGTQASVAEMQQEWHELTLRVDQLEAERKALEQENKAMRSVLERVIEHRQKSHSELVLLLTALVSKLPINDVGVIVSKLVDHNKNVSQTLAAFVKGTADEDLPQPTLLRELDETKRDLVAAMKPIVEELSQLDTPLESELLQGVSSEPETFFSPRMSRANRCFVKGQVPRERIVREFGEEALLFFNDMTTDAKLNPRPKPEEIALAFKNDFEVLLPQNTTLNPAKRKELLALYQRVQLSKSPAEASRLQKNAFLKLSFIAELLHFYENPNTEAPDALFAQRLPGLIEQLVLSGPGENLDEKLILLGEGLMAFVISAEHRQMIINNVGKGSSAGKTLKYVLRLRSEKVPASDPDQVLADFVKHLIPAPPKRAPLPETLAALLRLVDPGTQKLVVRFIMDSDRLRKQDSEALGRAIGAELGLKGLPEEIKAQAGLSPEIERKLAWANIKALISQRSEPTAIAATIRDRLNAKYDAEEIRQSWITLTEADPISLIRIFCQIPYRADGKTDSIARTVLETYVTRLMHEKYAAAYNKVVNSLRNMFTAKADSPTLLNFMALVRWVSPEAADKLSADIGMPLPAPQS